MKIKNYTKLILFTAAIFSFQFVNAQIKLGPVAGINMANISGDGDSSNAMKLGFHFGGIVDIAVSDNFIVSPGVIFSIKGTQDKDESKFKSNLSYIEIPINAKYQMESGLNFFAGPYFALLLSAKATDGTTDVDVKDFVNSSDFGVNVGLGYTLESGLGFSAQYGLGLANINKDIAGVDDTPSSKNSCIGVSVRYMFGGN